MERNINNREKGIFHRLSLYEFCFNSLDNTETDTLKGLYIMVLKLVVTNTNAKGIPAIFGSIGCKISPKSVIDTSG